MQQRVVEGGNEEKTPRPGDLRLAAGVERMQQALRFTGEQYVPGAGVEICYEHFHRYAFAASFVKPGARVLDLGCGAGYGSLYLSGRCTQVYAVDIDSSCIAALKTTIDALRITNVECIQADATRLLEIEAIPAGSIDVVVCHEFIEHVSADAQRRIVQAIGSGKGPFHEKTIFLVSTPDKEQYGHTLEERNEFHVSELTAEEFRKLLGASFAHQKLFWQGGATANCIYPLPDSYEETDAAQQRVVFLRWIDEIKLLATLSALPAHNGVYLYGVASNGALPAGAGVSALLDLSQRMIHERLSIAAYELQKSKDALTALETKVAPVIELEIALSAERERAGALQANFDLQGMKIKELLTRCEELGHESHELKRELATLKVEADELRRVLPLTQNHVENLERELDGWRTFVQRRLSPSLEEAARRLDLLLAYERAMGSLAHRAISWVGRRLRGTWVGRRVRRMVDWANALYQA